MAVEVVQEIPDSLAEYASVPITFTVSRVLEPAPPGSFDLKERRLQSPYVKDYGAFPDEKPTKWSERYDISQWGFFAARFDGRRVGSAAVAFNSPEFEMLAGRIDIAVLLDIRVAPDLRGKGIGSQLFHAAVRWTEARGCHSLLIETQNTNVDACNFYKRHGCTILSIDGDSYPHFPHELKIIWLKTPTPSPPNE